MAEQIETSGVSTSANESGQVLLRLPQGFCYVIIQEESDCEIYAVFVRTETATGTGSINIIAKSEGVSLSRSSVGGVWVTGMTAVKDTYRVF